MRVLIVYDTIYGRIGLYPKERKCIGTGCPILRQACAELGRSAQDRLRAI